MNNKEMDLSIDIYRRSEQWNRVYGELTVEERVRVGLRDILSLGGRVYIHGKDWGNERNKKRCRE